MMFERQWQVWVQFCSEGSRGYLIRPFLMSSQRLTGHVSQQGAFMRRSTGTTFHR